MSDLIPTSGGGLPARVQRQLAREIAGTQACGAVLAARQATKIAVIGETAVEAMFEGSRVLGVAGILMAEVPFGQAQLAGIAGAALASMQEVVLRTGRSVQ